VIDGVQKCPEENNNCRVELSVGSHQVEMGLTDFFVRKESVIFSKDSSQLEWKLDSNFTTLKADTSPSGLNVTINGKSNKTPIEKRVRPNSLQKVMLKERCYEARAIASIFRTRLRGE
jgi:hypothetical protein